MKKVFLKRFLSVSLLLAVALTFNFSGYIDKAEAKDTGKEKIFIKNHDNSMSTDTYVSVVPIPEEFDVAKATDEELEYYNIPKKPKDSKQLALWKRMYSHRWVKPEITKTNVKHQTYQNSIYKDDRATTSSAISINTTNARSTCFKDNWAGYVCNDSVNTVFAEWRVPRVSAPSNELPAYSSQWIGLGGYDGAKTLVQDGTEADVYSDGSTSYYFWYELLGTNYKSDYQLRINSIPISPGDEIESTVRKTISGNTMTVYFYLCNETQNQETSFNVTVTQFDDTPNTPEWISEATSHSDLKSYPFTTDVGSNAKAVAFENATYRMTDNVDPVGIASMSNLVRLTMKNNTDVLATPTDIGTGTEPYCLFVFPIYAESFNINWQNYN